MVKLIRDATSCNVTVGQNGKVWISGKDIAMEVATKKIIEFITENATITGLTSKVESFIKEMGLSNNKPEIVAENTDKEAAIDDEPVLEEKN